MVEIVDYLTGTEAMLVDLSIIINLTTQYINCEVWLAASYRD